MRPEKSTLNVPRRRGCIGSLRALRRKGQTLTAP